MERSDTINKNINIKDMTLVSMFSALIMVGAFIKIPIPLCPFTLQFLFTTLAGTLLGKNRGAMAVIIYILLGLMGIPVFSNGGGISYIFQPTFGYLIGFIFGTYITGLIIHNGKFNNINILIGCFAGLIIVYFCGMIYCYFMRKLWLDDPISITSLFLYCFVLAVPGDVVLCIVSTIITKRLLPIIKDKGI
ncbi:MAG TPA: biotin transporter BioY [Eubacterium sp.]|nr:biotin transporter BioY [Eubacterium sp.]HAV90484.1 biotin transporter BioY [Eubacterium sp.]